MVDLDKAVKDFKNMFCLQGSMGIIKLLEDAYKGKLMILQILVCNNGKLFAGEIAKELGVSTARVAAAIKGLVAKGYVKRSQTEEDGRKVLITITNEGKDILTLYINKVDNILKENFKKVTEEELNTFIQICTKLFS